MVNPPWSSPRRARASPTVARAASTSSPARRNFSSSPRAQLLSSRAAGPLPMPSQSRKFSRPASSLNQAPQSPLTDWPLRSAAARPATATRGSCCTSTTWPLGAAVSWRRGQPNRVDSFASSPPCTSWPTSGPSSWMCTWPLGSWVTEHLPRMPRAFMRWAMSR